MTAISHFRQMVQHKNYIKAQELKQVAQIQSIQRLCFFNGIMEYITYSADVHIFSRLQATWEGNNPWRMVN
jgi:hypothetical protein